MAIRGRVTGQRELRRIMRRVGKRIGSTRNANREIFNPLSKMLLQPVVVAVRSRTPRGDTGRMRKSVRRVQGFSRGGKRWGAAVGYDFKRVPYSQVLSVEYGSKKNRSPRRTLQTVFDSQVKRGDLERTLLKLLMEAMIKTPGVSRR